MPQPRLKQRQLSLQPNKSEKMKREHGSCTANAWSRNRDIKVDCAQTSRFEAVETLEGVVATAQPAQEGRHHFDCKRVSVYEVRIQNCKNHELASSVPTEAKLERRRP